MWGSGHGLRVQTGNHVAYVESNNLRHSTSRCIYHDCVVGPTLERVLLTRARASWNLASSTVPYSAG